jgi:hypothetical protein
MVKQKVQLNTPMSGIAEPTAVVAEEKTGYVTVFDKAKEYYKWLISSVSIVLAFLVDNQDIITRLFGVDHQANGWVALAILVLGNVGLLLKENEKWVNKLPGS